MPCWSVTVLALDTHAVVKELKAAGFTDEQAEAVTKVVRQAQDVDLSSLATKIDLAAVKGEIAGSRAEMAAMKIELKGDIAILRSDFEKNLAETKADILKWMISAIGIQTVIIVGAVLALTRLAQH